LFTRLRSTAWLLPWTSSATQPLSGLLTAISQLGCSSNCTAVEPRRGLPTYIQVDCRSCCKASLAGRQALHLAACANGRSRLCLRYSANMSRVTPGAARARRPIRELAEMLRARELLLGRAPPWLPIEIHVLGVCVCVCVCVCLCACVVSVCLCVCVCVFRRPSCRSLSLASDLTPLTYRTQWASHPKSLPPSLSELTLCCRRQHLAPPPSPPPPPFLHPRPPLPSDICSTAGFNTCHACAES
jgi:hypothetical protein